MAIKLRISNQITFRVEGTIRLDNSEQRFDFELVASRLPEDELQTIGAIKSFETAMDALVRVARDWKGVYGDDGTTPVSFSEVVLRELLREYPGLVWIVLVEYVKASGARAREKN